MKEVEHSFRFLYCTHQRDRLRLLAFNFKLTSFHGSCLDSPPASQRV